MTTQDLLDFIEEYKDSINLDADISLEDDNGYLYDVSFFDVLALDNNLSIDINRISA